MNIKIQDLTGAALDWAVNQIEECCDDPNAPPFSTNWAQGGPIIERECIDLYHSGTWSAEMVQGEDVIHTEGSTPLIAAMRCYVASQLGDEVDIPNELVEV